MTRAQAEMNLKFCKWAINLMVERLDLEWSAEGERRLLKLIDRHAWLLDVRNNAPEV